MYYEFKVQIYTESEETAMEVYDKIKNIRHVVGKSVLWQITRKVVK